MRDMLEIATLFLETRIAWMNMRDELKADAVPLGATWQFQELEQRMKALAWVLEVDLEVMNAPKPGIFDKPEQVRLTRVLLAGHVYYLIEVPANPDPSYRTEYWAAFFSPTHLRELGDAILHALVPGARPLPLPASPPSSTGSASSTSASSGSDGASPVTYLPQTHDQIVRERIGLDHPDRPVRQVNPVAPDVADVAGTASADSSVEGV